MKVPERTLHFWNKFRKIFNFLPRNKSINFSNTQKLHGARSWRQDWCGIILIWHLRHKISSSNENMLHPIRTFIRTCKRLNVYFPISSMRSSEVWKFLLFYIEKIKFISRSMARKLLLLEKWLKKDILLKKIKLSELK